MNVDRASGWFPPKSGPFLTMVSPSTGNDRSSADTATRSQWKMGVLLDETSQPHPRRGGQTYIEADPRWYQRWGDPRRTVRLLGDEFGNLGSGSDPNSSPFFGVGTVGFTDLCVASDLIRLGRDLRLRAGATVGRYFSAKSDTFRTRAEVFAILTRHSLFIDATYVDRNHVPEYFRASPIALYRALWFDHLSHVLPGFLDPEQVVHVQVASLHSDTTRRELHRAYALATG